MDQSRIRNIAIIAHVDHGKTTLVDQFFRQSGMFRANQVVEERLMDSMDLEKERGMTIAAKNGSFRYKDYFVNIIDTPGHADFGGQVERVLRMADGALLLVDAVDGPMPQTYFVLRKALALRLPVIVVVNKIDLPDHRCDWVVNQVFDLFVKLDAPEHLLDFPVVYASARDGYATEDYNERGDSMEPLFEKIIECVPPPKGDPNGPLQMLISSLSYSPFLGRLVTGKISSGCIRIGQDVAAAREGKVKGTGRVTKLYRFEADSRVEIATASVGEIVVVAGIEVANIGDTLTDPLAPITLPPVKVDPPTVSMKFIVNDSPFAGREGKFLTSRHLRERLFQETLSDVALVVEETGPTSFEVSGRGELHLSILIEKMRREGYEFQVTRPEVILKDVDGKKLEPYEELTVDVDENYVGGVIENLGRRRGIVLQMNREGGRVRLVCKIPTRGLLGFRSEFMNDTKGTGVMNYVFLDYCEYAGEIKDRRKGVLIAKENCVTVAAALGNLEDRGTLFLGPGEKVYGGQIIGEHCRDNDLVVNPAKGKKMTNVRCAGADDAIILTPPRVMTLEKCISFIREDELIEVTPQSIRLRKQLLSEVDRLREFRRAGGKAKSESAQLPAE